MSYDGGMDFGLLGDYDAMPDLDAFGELLAESADGAARGGARAVGDGGCGGERR